MWHEKSSQIAVANYPVTQNPGSHLDQIIQIKIGKCPKCCLTGHVAATCDFWQRVFKMRGVLRALELKELGMRRKIYYKEYVKLSSKNNSFILK